MRAVAGSPVTAACDREPLVGGDVLGEAEQLGRERRLRERHGPPRSIRAGTSTTSSSASPASVPPLRTSTSCTSPSPGTERGDEARRGLAVERAAALLEQRGLLVSAGSRYSSSSRARSRRPPPRAASPSQLLGQDLVVARRSTGGSRTGSTPSSSSSCRGSADLLGERVAVLGEQLREHVLAVDETRAHPRQVVETDLVDDDALRLDAEQPREPSAGSRSRRCRGPTARWPASSSARVTIPTGFVKSTIHASGADELAHALGDLEHDGHRAQRLGEAAGAGRLLADAAAGERHRLVREPRRLAADADLDQDEVGAVDGAVEVVGDEQLAGEALRAPASARPARRRPPAAPRRCRAARARRRRSARARARGPETSSGVYVEPPPMTAIFIPSPRSA